MAKLRVGLVGLRRGQGFVRTVAAHPDLEVAALCDLKPDVLVDLPPAFGLGGKQPFTRFHEFVAQPLELVGVAATIEDHAQQAIQAMEAGKHVLCEQTAVYTVDDCRLLIETVKRTGRKYMMAENYCYFHYVRQWRKLIEAGKLGQIF